jgi:hypothetical protein
MAMGHREKLKNGDEWDVTTGWRHFLKSFERSRIKKQIKITMSRRHRRKNKLELKKSVKEETNNY